MVVLSFLTETTESNSLDTPSTLKKSQATSTLTFAGTTSSETTLPTTCESWKKTTQTSTASTSLSTLPREFQQMTWKTCTQRSTQQFEQILKALQRKTETRPKCRSSRTRERRPQQNVGIVFSTKFFLVARKMQRQSKEAFPTWFPISSHFETSPSLPLVTFSSWSIHGFISTVTTSEFFPTSSEVDESPSFALSF